jgi:hypothetical protein
MKFLSFKCCFFLYLFVSLTGLEIKSKFLKISHKKITRTESENKIPQKEKVEAFFRGFVISAISRIARGQVTEKEKDQKSFDEHMRIIASQIISNCVPEFLNEYDAVIRESKKKKGYDYDFLTFIFKSEEIDEVIPVCEKKQSIDKLDGNEYSTLNVLGGWIKDIFVNNPYYVDYKKFKEEKEAILANVDKLTKKYAEIFKSRKDSFVDKKAAEIAKNIYSALTATFFGKKDICQVLDDFYSIDFFDHLKGLMVGSMKGLVCGSVIFASYFPNIALENMFKSIFENFGLSLAQGVLVAVFPPALAGYVLGFLWSNFFELTKMAKYAVVSGSESEEKDLYQSIGGIAGNEIVSLIK